jgi:hypothetical protein
VANIVYKLRFDQTVSIDALYDTRTTTMIKSKWRFIEKLSFDDLSCILNYIVVLLVLLSSTYGSNGEFQTNPMFDPYVETITTMNLESLMNIPEKSDEQFLNDLFYGDDSIEGK